MGVGDAPSLLPGPRWGATKGDGLIAARGERGRDQRCGLLRIGLFQRDIGAQCDKNRTSPGENPFGPASSCVFRSSRTAISLGTPG